MPPYPYSKVKDPLVLPPGYLRTEIQIVALAQDRDSAGQPVQDLSLSTPVLAAMAAVEMIAETEIYQTGQFADNITHRIVMRYPGAVGIASGMRVLTPTDGQAFVVQSTVNVRKRNRVLWIFCLEINGD